ncbi:hypothetical protein FEM03_05405 [Phragmitibacter flavus]|uniref:Uncharacterized protein n=1 Tax=Phragmitibacter flavus TaxID=2576071 RepID=A0A5R8KH57_9BACT|nr:hypothetical protein [Phragmitibacter flavus]TLD71581.1 hypothetical protein FEM03_05405 [Phragmitibacter flavus]
MPALTTGEVLYTRSRFFASRNEKSRRLVPSLVGWMKGPGWAGHSPFVYCQAYLKDVDSIVMKSAILFGLLFSICLTVTQVQADIVPKTVEISRGYQVPEGFIFVVQQVHRASGDGLLGLRLRVSGGDDIEFNVLMERPGSIQRLSQALYLHKYQEIRSLGMEKVHVFGLMMTHKDFDEYMKNGSRLKEP